MTILKEKTRTKARRESFFGIHSDFHAKPQDGLVIGQSLCERDIRELCETLRPDFVQIDCKGHPGWTSYPTRFSNAMPHFKGDPLALWRRITHEYGIALYMHFSGFYDAKYCAEHPEEAVMRDDGTYADSVRADSRYFDDFFIPQISELAERYEIDGVWIDGDCWSVLPDYRPESLSLFEKASGICLNGARPTSEGEPYFREYLEYTREQYRRTLRHYTDVLHAAYPNLQICSNWAFSDHMPERVSAGVDFLSGDLNPQNCFYSASYAGRMLAQQGLLWDLMSWNFRYRVYGTPLIPPKHPSQIMQEAAAVISLGGAYQDNVAQLPDGSPDITRMRNLKPLAEFLRAREPFCFRGVPVHQAVMLVSTQDRYAQMTAPFTREGMEKLMGLTALLCDAGQSLELACEHTLKGQCAAYPMIVVPELYEGLADTTVEELRAYVQNGGSLMLVGTSACRFFAERNFGFLAEPYTDFPEVPGWAESNVGHATAELLSGAPSYFSLGDGYLGVASGACRVTAEHPDAVTHGWLHRSLRDGSGVPFATVFPYGKGKVAAIGADLGTQYNEGMQYLHRALIKRIAAELYTPMAEILSAHGLLHVVCLSVNGRTMLQLVNVNGNHASNRCVTEENIPPLVDIELTLATDACPQKLILQPENRELAFAYEQGRVRFSVDRIDIHGVIEVVM